MNDPDSGSASSSDQIDWPGLIRLGLGALRLEPDVFWAMSPAEFRLALEGAGLLNPGAAMPMDRMRLNRLMQAYPDASKTTSENKE